jgi:2-aminoadipate transaminase
VSIAWSARYALRIKVTKSSAIRELLRFTQDPEVISFAGGLPASDLFPIERFEEAMYASALAAQARHAQQLTLGRFLASAFQYPQI